MSRFSVNRSNGIVYITFPQMEESGPFTHAFSTRIGGSSPFPSSALNLSFIREDRPENVENNLNVFLRAIGWPRERPITLRQRHSDRVHIINQTSLNSKGKLEGDGLITNCPGVLLGIQVADCYPIIVIDPRRKAAAAFHAGWRSTAARIAEKGIRLLTDAYGCNPADLLAAIGPGIGACCFEVGAEVVEVFAREFSYAGELIAPAAGGKARIDLLEANRRQLLDAGMAPEKVLSLGLCTACRTDLFFSHRAERGRTGRMLAVVGIQHR